MTPTCAEQLSWRQGPQGCGGGQARQTAAVLLRSTPSQGQSGWTCHSIQPYGNYVYQRLRCF